MIEKLKENPLIAQILKFGVVGFICFFIDFGIYTFLVNVVNVHYFIAGAAGFIISVTVNYILSMKYVFESRDDMSKTKEFIIFVVLSAFGLVINELILYVCIDLIYGNWTWLSSWLPIKLMNVGAKVAATGVVMVYNFITRKIFLEKKD